MLTEKDYCDYDTSRELKELGFVAGLGEDNCTCCLYDDAWHDQVDRPLLYEAQKWLREEWELIVTILLSPNTKTSSFWVQRKEDGCVLTQGNMYSSFEESLSEGIKEAIKILKEK